MDMYALLFNGIAIPSLFASIPLVKPSRRSYRKRTASLAIIVYAVLLRPVGAEQVILFDFDGPGEEFNNQPEFVAPNLIVGPWSDADGTLTSFGGDPGNALAARDFSDGNTLALTVTVTPGWLLLLDGFSFTQRASASGPTDWALTIAGAQVSAAPTTLGFSLVTEVLTPLPLEGQFLVALTGGGASSTSGTWRIDNFALNGALTQTAVPLPGAFPPMLLGLALIGRQLSLRKQSANSGN